MPFCLVSLVSLVPDGLPGGPAFSGAPVANTRPPARVRMAHPCTTAAIILTLLALKRLLSFFVMVSSAPVEARASLETVVVHRVATERTAADRRRQTAAASAASRETGRQTRSAVTNGKKLLPQNNGRSAQGRRLKDLIIAFSEPLGGYQHLAEPERALIRNAASMTVTLEELQSRVSRGEMVDLEQLTRLSNSQARVLATLRRGAPRQVQAPRADAGSPASAAVGARRPPTVEEVIAEQIRRVAGSSSVVMEAESASAGPDLSGFSDDVLARARRLLESSEGEARP